LREACEQAVRWREAGVSAVSIAVNVSAMEFRHREFYDHAIKIFEATKVDPTCIQLELTKTVLMRDVVSSASLLAKLKAIRLKIAVDDFGTGYSSLSYLNQFPIDVLKIDQMFVKAIDTCAAGNGAIVSAVIGMGMSLRQHVIAEGVEEDVQLAFLKAHKCDEGQGYLFSRPVSAAEMQVMLSTGKCA
jgi:EAL domain-containing protein (putative c-di-GMP-specific phosphodiesterase class I)